MIPFVFEPLAAQTSTVYFCYRPADQQVLYVSPAYEHVLGGIITAVNEELPAWLAALHPDDRPYLTERLTYAATQCIAVEEVLIRVFQPNGHLRWLTLTAVGHMPSDGTPGPLLIGQLVDVTRTQAILENANRYQAKKNSMLEILSHDLASPLVLVEQASEYITEKVEHLADTQLNQLIGNIRQACREGVDIIRDFVDQEFLDSTAVDLKLVRLDLAERLHIVIDNYQERQHAAGHTFQFTKSHASIYAQIDENKFLQVINNLIGNAIKFTPNGGHIRMYLTQHPQHLLITVEDNGIGIPQEQQARLFERFTPARRVGLRGEKTTGLGMSIIKTIVELHHGRIWVESEEGQGSRFFIQLPLLRE